MSLWIPRRNEARRMSYLAIEGPVVLILPAFSLVALILISNLYAAPIHTLLVCFSIAAAGSILISIAKCSLSRPGWFLSFGSAGMSRGMRTIYRIGLFFLALGTVLTLLGVAFILRR